MIATRSLRNAASRRQAAWLAFPIVVVGATVGLLPWLYGFAFVAGAAALIVALASPVLGLAALAVVIPLSPASGDAGRLPIAIPDAMGVVVLGAVTGFGLARRRFGLTLTRAFWPGIAFLGAVVVSAGFAPDLGLSAKEFLRWAEALGMLVVAASICQRIEHRRLVVAALLVALLAESALGWAQFLLRRGPDSFQIGSFLRAYGTFGQPNPFAGYLVMTAPIGIAIVLWAFVASRTEGTRSALFTPMVLLAAGASGVAVVALLMSLSRGALLGFAVAGVALMCLLTRRGVALVAAAIVAVSLLLVLDSSRLIPATVSQRIAQIWEYVGWFDASKVTPTPQNWAVVERMAHWQAAWNMYITHPVTGVGPGNYPVAYPSYRVNDFWLDPLGHAHNLYLNVMAELGFPGLVTYFVQWFAWLAVALAGFVRGRSAYDRALAAGVLASLLGVAVHNIFDNLTVHGLETEAGLLIGLCASIAREPRELART